MEDATRFALRPAATIRETRFVLRPVNMARAFLLIPEEQVEKPREFLDRFALESSYEPPNVSLRTIGRLIWAAWRGEARRRNVSL